MRYIKENKKNQKECKNFEKLINKKRKIQKRRKQQNQQESDNESSTSENSINQRLKLYTIDQHQINIQKLKKKILSLEQNVFSSEIKNKPKIIELGKIFLIGLQHVISNDQLIKISKNVKEAQKQNEQKFYNIITNSEDIHPILVTPKK